MVSISKRIDKERLPTASIPKQIGAEHLPAISIANRGALRLR